MLRTVFSAVILAGALAGSAIGQARTKLRAVYAEASQRRQGAVTGLRRRDSRIEPNVIPVTSGRRKYRPWQNGDMFAEGGSP